MLAQPDNAKEQLIVNTSEPDLKLSCANDAENLITINKVKIIERIKQMRLSVHFILN